MARHVAGARTEEVAASSEELSAQLDQTSVGAHELADTADQVRQLASRFTLEAVQPAQVVAMQHAPRLRAA